MFNVKEQTVKKIIYKYKKFHLVEKKKKGGPRCKFSDEQKQFIIDQQNNNNGLTYKQIEKKFNEQFNKHIVVVGEVDEAHVLL